MIDPLSPEDLRAIADLADNAWKVLFTEDGGFRIDLPQVTTGDWPKIPVLRPDHTSRDDVVGYLVIDDRIGFEPLEAE